MTNDGGGASANCVGMACVTLRERGEGTAPFRYGARDDGGRRSCERPLSCSPPAPGSPTSKHQPDHAQLG